MNFIVDTMRQESLSVYIRNELILHHCKESVSKDFQCYLLKEQEGPANNFLFVLGSPNLSLIPCLLTVLTLCW